MTVGIIDKPLIYGKPLDVLPEDLYIPPDALAVLLESFSGPLDLLLYLIRKQNIDILDIPIADITMQYMAYIEAMKLHQLELASDYLLMAATLAYIKSKIILPKAPDVIEEEEDPRLQLVRQLQLYEQFKEAAVSLDSLARLERDNFKVQLKQAEKIVIEIPPDVSIEELLDAMLGIQSRLEKIIPHQITRENLSVKDRMNDILSKLIPGKVISFISLFNTEEGRSGVIVSFLAILELSRLSLIHITQREPFSLIYLEEQNHETADVNT